MTLRPLVVLVGILVASFPAQAAYFIDTDGITLFTFPETELSKAQNEPVLLGDMIFRRSDISPLGFRGKTWTNATLPISFAPNVSSAEQTAFWDACAAWSFNTPIKCKARAAEANYIRVETWDGTGGKCSSPSASCSYVGMSGGEQAIYIRDYHWGIRYILEHELGHAIGMIHEHQRNDRGAFVRVVDSNVEPGANGNFTPMGARIYSPYDVDSIMHYGNCTFSRHQGCANTTPAFWTMFAEDCFRDLVGGTVITSLDRQGVQLAYAAALSSLFKRIPGGSCGKLSYSLRQLSVACPGGCETVGRVTFSKLKTDKEKTCGFLARRDGVRYCRTKYKKDFVRMWTGKACPHIDCGTGCLNERWTRCGCSKQIVKPTCIDFRSRIDRGALKKMISDGEPTERKVGTAIGAILAMIDHGRAEKAIEFEIGPLVLSNSGGEDGGERLQDLACYCEVLVASRRLTLPGYRLAWDDVRRIARGMGMATL
jgi:hypothetical protein